MTPERLRAFRKSRSWSLRQFAEVVGVHRVTLGKFEKPGAKIPHWLALACAAVAFNLPAME